MSAHVAHVHLALVFHQHQPLGNYGFVFEELYAKSYEPLVACLERHPGVKAGLHYSGPLLEWLQTHRPGYIERIRGLVARGQVEILGGGYYEPILPALARADRVGQLRKMRHEIEVLFGTAPSGMWLAERVWEPSLPVAIREAGYAWTIVDDVHFQATGLNPDDLSGWYLTEDEGEAMGVFASSTRFRYLVPWGTVDACIDFLRAHGDRSPGGLLAMGDDGEKFGGWPTTHLHCWENGWVDAFFARLEEEAHWIETAHLGPWQQERKPQGLAYLPSASYQEMGEWSLPPAEQQALHEARDILRGSGREDLVHLLRGGHWRNFLVRYPEVELLHRRLQLLLAEAHRTENEAALDHAWRAQCNCPYWHGVFGGVYLEHIRHANNSELAKADAALFPGPQPPDTRDWNLDGRDEVCLRSAAQLAIVAPHQGGRIEHWEDRSSGWHFTHAIARRPEPYHRDLHAAPSGDTRSIHDTVRLKDAAAAAEALAYDTGMRLAAQDTLIQGPAGREEYARQRLSGAGEPTSIRAEGGCLAMRLACAGGGYQKTVTVATGLRVEYRLPAGVTLFSEWNLSLPEGPGGVAPECTFSADGLLHIASGDWRLGARHDADDAWVTRLTSVSNTEDGVELAPQGWCIVFAFTAREQEAERSIQWEPAP